MALKVAVDETVSPIKVTVTSDKRNVGTVSIAGESGVILLTGFKWSIGSLKPTLVSDDGTTAVFTLA